MNVEAVHTRWSRVAACGVLLLAACGGGSPAASETVPSDEVLATAQPTASPSPSPTSTPTPRPTPTPVAFHDFSAIEGDWEGTGREGATGSLEVRIVASIEAGAPTRGIVGEAYYFTGPEPDCRASWLARSAEPPTYRVRDVPGAGCVPGTVELVHDPEAEALSYRFEPDDGNPAWVLVGTLKRSDR